MLLTSSAFAEWLPTSGTEWVPLANIGEVTSYIDADTIQDQGNTKIIRILHDFSSPRVAKGVTFRSLIGQIKLDCTGKMMQVLYIAPLSGPMGKGDVLEESRGASEWSPAIPVPGSVNEAMMKKFCNY